MKKQLTCAVLALAFAFNVAPMTAVEASLTGNVYDFGNVQTRDNTYIAELRGVPVDGVVNLDRIVVAGQTITGWYLDASFTTPVEDEIFLPAGFITITEDIMVNGLYPKYASDVTGSTGGDVTTPPTTDGNFSPVPNTGVAVLAPLF